jgi:1-acyl-sn-glycerol-3-phosphate acyltransferase
MLKTIASSIIGCIAILLYLLNCLVVPSLIFICGVLYLVLPVSFIRKGLDYFIGKVLVILWVKLNNGIIWLTSRTKFMVRGVGELKHDGKYLLVSNHRSWVDILVIYKFFGLHTSMPVFFMKQELLWLLPVVGAACKAIGFPFMKRYSKSYLKKHPEKIGDDLAATKRSCQRYNNKPVTVVNFLEGTRFTEEKRARQGSKYQHLLKPKPGGFLFVIATMGQHLHDIINVTITYPDKYSFWDFACGRVKEIVIDYEVLPLDRQIIVSDYSDRASRTHLLKWLADLWQRKDQLIEKNITQYRG